MNRRSLLIAVLCLFCIYNVSGQESTPKVRVGGELYLAAYYDTYKSVDSREGVSYSFPMAPMIEERGYDLHQVGQFGMSPSQTRLHVRADGLRLLNADAHLFIETDFMGSTSAYYRMIRMRHAYLNLRWEKDELLLGQTNNLQMVGETVSGVLTSGAGSPITILERPIMIRYGRRWGENAKFYIAVSYHAVQTGDPENAETYEANRNNGFPSAEARIQFGDPDRLFFGIAGGFKSMMPRTVTATGQKTNERIMSGSVTAFLRATSRQGATLKIQGLYGSDLTHLGMIGGYAALRYEEGAEKAHYEYTNFIGASGWVDLESRPYADFRFGLFGGHMQNLGAGKPIDPKKMYAIYPGLNFTGRVSPRVTHQHNNLLLGIEYSLFYARWGEVFNNKYLPMQSYDLTYNHRITLLARYNF